MIDVLLADDDPTALDGLRALIDSDDDMRVVAEASTGDDAVRLTLEYLPDVLLLDASIPGLGGLAVTRRIVEDRAAAHVHVVLLTAEEMNGALADAVRGGASGYLVRGTAPADLLRALRVVSVGDALLFPGLARQLVAGVVPTGSATAPVHGVDDLTPREREVVGRAGAGMSNAEIADALCLPPASVRTHLSCAAKKLKARDRAQLVMTAHESGLT